MKKLISAFAALAAFAVFGIDANTMHDDIPGTATIGEIVAAGGGGGGCVDTNAVIDIIHKTVDGAARPLPKYLHALDFGDSYPDAAAEYYAQRGSGLPTASCSSVRSGNFLSRNFDYPFDDRAEFIVKMSAGPGRFASVGVANVGTNLTESFVTSGKHSRWYKALPGATVDGINENGVVAEINVVDGDPQTSGWHTTGDLHPLAAVRWALDHATNAQHAAEHLAANIRFPEGWQQNFHYMIADETSTYIVENGEAYPVPSALSPTGADQPVLTNFRLYPTHSTGEGQERYAALMSGANITSQWWTLTYTANGYRASDLPGITGDALTQLFDYWASKPREAHRGEFFHSSTSTSDFDLTWWQTVHTSIYDLTNRVLRIAVQETDDWYTFQVPASSLAGAVDEAKVRELAGEVVAPVAAEKRDKTDLDVYELTVTGMVHEVENDTDGLLASFRAATPVYAKSLSAWGLSGFDNDTWSFETIRGQSEDAKVIRYRFTNDLTGDEQDGSITRFFSVVTNGDRIATARTSIPFEKNGEFYVLDGNSVVLKDGAGYKGIAALPDLDAKLSKTDVIDPSSATTTGKAADALEVKEALAGKQDNLEAELYEGYIYTSSGVRANAEIMAMWFELNDVGASGEVSAYTVSEDDPDQEHMHIRTFADSDRGLPSGDIVVPRKNGMMALTSEISESNPAFSNAVLAVGIDTNVLAAVAASTNAVAQIGEFYAAFSDIGLTPTQGGMTLAGLLAALVAAVTWLKKTLGKVADNSGEPTDQFATDLMEKQVVINALHYALYSVPTTGEGANTLKDRAVNAFEFSGSLPAFPAQVSGYARDFLMNVTATATASDITLPETGATSVGDALAFTSGNTYLVAITEIEAKKYYIRVIDTTPANAA